MPNGQHTTALRLLAQDQEDLAVMSAVLQDGAGQIGHFVHDPQARTFGFQINRLRREARKGFWIFRGPLSRVSCAVLVADVASVRMRRVSQDEPKAVVQILALNFLPDTQPPGGRLQIVLAGDGMIELTVESVDVQMMDHGPAWVTQSEPRHLSDKNSAGSVGPGSVGAGRTDKP